VEEEDLDNAQMEIARLRSFVEQLEKEKAALQASVQIYGQEPIHPKNISPVKTELLSQPIAGPSRKGKERAYESAPLPRVSIPRDRKRSPTKGYEPAPPVSRRLTPILPPSTPLPRFTSTIAPKKLPTYPEPKTFSGLTKDLTPWLTSVKYFFLNREEYDMPEDRIRYALLLMTEKEPAKWAQQQHLLWERDSRYPFADWEEFEQDVKARYGDSYMQERSINDIKRIKMEGDDLLQYNRHFNNLLYQTGWDRTEGAVKEYYMAGLIPFYWDKVATSLANQLP